MTDKVSLKQFAKGLKSDYLAEIKNLKDDKEVLDYLIGQVANANAVVVCNKSEIEEIKTKNHGFHDHIAKLLEQLGKAQEKKKWWWKK